MPHMQVMQAIVMGASLSRRMAVMQAPRLPRTADFVTLTGMSRAFANDHCARLPGATLSDPWGGGHDTWKVGGKIFATAGASDDFGLAVKCPDIETAQLLIEMGRAVRAPYFHRSWVALPWGLVPDAELAERIDTSYALIRASLPRKIQASLG